MCLAVVLALVFLPFGGSVIGHSIGGASGGWIGAAIGVVLALALAGLPTAVYLGAEKKKYDRDRDRIA